MVYEWKCDGCGNIFDVVSTVDERNHPSDCPVCGQVSHRVVAQPFQMAYYPFPDGVAPIGIDGTYIKSKEHLREVCKREGLMSHYLEGKPSMEHKTPTTSPWSQSDHQELGQIYDATVGKV